MNFLAGWQVKVGIALVILLAFAGMYIALVRTQLKLIHTQQDAIEQALEDQSAILNQQTRDIELMHTLNEGIRNSFRSAEAGVARLNNRMNALNLRQQSTVQPSAVQEQLNRDTLATLRCNEIVTGAPVLESDATNEICPELVRSP